MSEAKTDHSCVLTHRLPVPEPVLIPIIFSLLRMVITIVRELVPGFQRCPDQVKKTESIRE